MNKKYLTLFLGLSLSTGAFANVISFQNAYDGNPGATTPLPSIVINCHVPNVFSIGLGSPDSELGTPKFYFMGGNSGTYQCSVQAHGTQYGSTWMPKIVPLGSFEMNLDLAYNTAYFYAFQVRPLLPQDNLGVYDDNTNKNERVIGAVSITPDSFKFVTKMLK